MFHHQDMQSRQLLETSMNDLDIYERSRTPPLVAQVTFPVAHDPSMPTLSPQQPAPNQSAILTSTSTSCLIDKCSELSSDICIYDSGSQNTVPTTVSATVAPPSLVPKSEPNSSTCGTKVGYFYSMLFGCCD